MNATSRLGMRGWRAAVPLQPLRPLRVLAACALVVAAAWSVASPASVLYRCVGRHGEVAYVSNTAGYQRCRLIGRWATPVVERVAQRRPVPPASAKPHATVLPGTPPRAVSANPAVLKVTPLGEGSSIEVHALVRKQAWEPLPIGALDDLGAHLLPRLLGVTGAGPPAAPAPAVAPPPSGLRAAAGKPIATPAPAPPPPKRGAVYRVVEKNGTVLYTNIAALAHGHAAKMLFTYLIECYACGLHSKIDWNTVPLHLADYRADIGAAARMTGVNAALLRAVIHAESGFNPRALSYKGAQGLMQLMPATAFEMGVGDAFDPAENISGGARYLALLLHDYHGDVKLAAAAYNAGANAVAKYDGVPPYAETQVYVKRVAVLYQRYRKALGDHGAATALAAAGRGG